MGATRLRGLLWLALCALALLGCGAAPRSSAVASAAAKTAEAGTARIESVMRLETDGHASTFHSHGVVDYRRNRFDTTFEYDGKVTSRLIAIGQVSYSTISGGDWALPAGKRWVRFEGDDDGEAHGCDGVNDAMPEDWMEPFSDDSGNIDVEPTPTNEDGDSGGTIILHDTGFSGVSAYSDPGDVLGYLEDAGAGPSLVGRELVRDTATTHYHGKVDPRASLRRALEKDGWPQQSIDCAVASTSDEPLYVDAWIGDDGLVRRLVTTMAMDFGPSGTSTWADTTDFFDFGKAVDIEPPPETEIISLEDWEKFADEPEETEDQP